MTGITTHILDASLGKPAAGITVRLFYIKDNLPILLAEKQTDNDGRIKDFAVASSQFIAGDYQLIFEVKAYFITHHAASFYPKVCIDFTVADSQQHYHVPLLISPYSYSTYRGS